MRNEFNTPWPISKTNQPALSVDENNRAERIARNYLKADPALSGEWFKRRGVTSGWAPGPSLYIEDHRSIDLATEADAHSFEYRSMSLASDGDYYLVSSPRSREYENYLRDSVGLAAPTVLEIPSSDVILSRRMAAACCNHEQLLNTLSNAAKAGNGLNIAPFISSGDIWRLGSEIARRSQCQIRISGPPPRLANCANNKLWFAELVCALISRSALPLTYAVYGLASAASGVQKLARISDQIVIKVPASAGAMGNIVLDSSDFSTTRLTDIRNILLGNLKEIGWSGQFPLLLGVWDQAVSSSPSVQMWLPYSTQGAPIIEGLFVQSISDIRSGFTGAAPTKLPDEIEQQIRREALLIGVALQRMGYFGRLSLDAVILKDTVDHFGFHWIEANARWGGVSIPMTVAHRIRPRAMNNGLLIVQNFHKGGTIQRLQKLLSEQCIPQVALKDNLCHGLIFLTPPESGHLVFVIIGFSEKTAATFARHTINLSESLVPPEPNPPLSY